MLICFLFPVIPYFACAALVLGATGYLFSRSSHILVSGFGLLASWLIWTVLRTYPLVLESHPPLLRMARDIFMFCEVLMWQDVTFFMSAALVVVSAVAGVRGRAHD